MNNLSGIFPVVMTPFLEDSSVDEGALRYIINFLIDKKLHGLVILGSSSEGIYLNDEEKKQIIDVTVSENKKRVPLIVGVISPSTDEAIKLSNYAKEKGADILMIGLPVFFPLKFKDVYNHYLTISEKVSLPIIYYHFPQQFHLHLKPDEFTKLFEIKNLIGIKNSNLNIKEMEKQLQAIKREISLFSGSSLLLYETLKIGGAGAICPLPILIPDIVLSLYNSYKNKDYKSAKIMQDKIFDVLPVLIGKKVPIKIAKFVIPLLSKLGIKLKGSDFSLSVFKEALRYAGYPLKPFVKSPLPQIEEGQKKIVQKVFQKYEN